ncbi:MAG: hypothetical protein H3Z51_09970 [archaeon]|nr:hypothetical protein [archaeon]
MLQELIARIRERIDSLEPFLKFQQHGLGMEGWLRVETVAALRNIPEIKEIKVKNKGPDLTIFLSNEPEPKEVELKAHNSTSVAWCKSWRNKYPKVTCLFLMRKGRNLSKDLESEGFLVKIEDVDSNWITGILKLSNPRGGIQDAES